jgi:hypothetical protein
MNLGLPGVPYRPIRPLGGRATAASLGIAAFTVVIVASTFTPLVGVWAAREVARSGGTEPGNILTLVEVTAILVQALGYLSAGVCFLVWLSRARANLAGFFDAYPRLSSGLVVGAWFLPLANLVLPGAVVADIARESVPPDQPDRRGRLVALVWSWWTVSVLAPIAMVAGWVATDNPDRSRLEQQLNAGESVDVGRARDLFGALVIGQLPATLLWLAAAVLAIVMIHRINTAQYDRVDRLRAPRPGPAVPGSPVAPTPVSAALPVPEQVPGGAAGATISG